MPQPNTNIWLVGHSMYLSIKKKDPQFVKYPRTFSLWNISAVVTGKGKGQNRFSLFIVYCNNFLKTFLWYCTLKLGIKVHSRWNKDGYWAKQLKIAWIIVRRLKIIGYNSDNLILYIEPWTSDIVMIYQTQILRRHDRVNQSKSIFDVIITGDNS